MTITIITPSFNQGRFIEAALQSVLQQNIPNLQYLVVDGGSTDGTLDVLRRYETHLQWTSAPDRGHADAVNKGLMRASGDIIGWLNSDDIYCSDALQIVCDYFAQHAEVDVVYGHAHYIDADGNIIGDYPVESWDATRLREICYLCQPAVFFRRHVVEQCGLLDTRWEYILDYAYWLRLVQCGMRFAHLDHVLAASRLHPEARSVNYTLRIRHTINDFMREQYGHVPHTWLQNYAHTAAHHQVSRRHRLIVALVMSAYLLRASWHWNRRVSVAVLMTCVRWLGGNFKASLAGRRDE